MTNTDYTLTEEESKKYNSGDDRLVAEVSRSLRQRFGRIRQPSTDHETAVTTVYDLDGYIIDVYTK